MANHFSALKRARQTVKRTEANRANRSRLRSAIRRFREALASGNKDNATTAYRGVASAIDKSVQKGVVHGNTAARYKSRLNARVKALGTK